MKGFAIYWFVGCILVGAGIGMREHRCPDDPYPKIEAVAAEIIFWPAGLTWAIVNPRLPTCKSPAAS